jgi:hypothetical protein
MILESTQAMNIPAVPHESPLTREINKKRKLPITPMNVNIFNYWRNHSKALPLLYKIVLRYLCIKATSCSSERAFYIFLYWWRHSDCKEESFRSSEKIQNVLMLVYIRNNMKKLQLSRLVVEYSIEEEEKN